MILTAYEDRWFIEKTLERRTKIQRRDPDKGKGFQTLAANFSHVFLVMALNENYNLKRLERYLTAAWDSGASPVIILTKPDLALDLDNQVQEVASIGLGLPVHIVNGLTGEGLADLAGYLQAGNSILLLGSSGVGKSSLTNGLSQGEVMATGAVRQEDGRGRHTTTHRQMIDLPSGASIIDSPGLRELGMGDLAQGLDKAFPEVEDLLGQCRFSNCRHGGEPGCAIQAALAEGRLSLDRWQTYLKLEKEAAYAKKRQELKEKRANRRVKNF